MTNTPTRTERVAKLEQLRRDAHYARSQDFRDECNWWIAILERLDELIARITTARFTISHLEGGGILEREMLLALDGKGTYREAVRNG